MATPWIPSGYDTYPLVNIENVPAVQVQFKRTMNETEHFLKEDCDIFGRSGFLIGIKMCVAESQALPGSVIAGISALVRGD